jgi:hypothetical protein
MLSLVFYRVIKTASIAEKNHNPRYPLSPYKTPKKAFYFLYLHFYAFLKGEVPYILVFEYNIFRHTSYLNVDGTAK